jgi:hypothetical protein
VAKRHKKLPEEDLADLQWAHQQLEHPSLAARLCDVIGTPFQHGLHLFPKPWQRRLRTATEVSIHKTLNFAIGSMEHVAPTRAHDQVHKLLVAGTGAAGGFFGPLTLLIELPVTTMLMLRSIADIADSQGEDLTTPEARLACMEVFALGGRSPQDTAADAGYYGLRVTLGFHFSDALLHTGQRTPLTIPTGVELVRAIAARFGTVVSDAAAARMIPLAGAVTGAALNLVFMQHFQDVARGHFIIRRLERSHGAEAVRAAYEQVQQQEAAERRPYSPVEGW